MKRLTFLITSIFALAFAAGAGAESIVLKWDAVLDDPDVSGYEVHYGLQSGQHQWTRKASGAATDSQIVESLVPNSTYYFAVRSCNDDCSRVSAFSNEISARIVSTDSMPPAVAISTSPTGPTYTSAQTVTISAAASDDRGVVRVEFYDGATLKGTDTTSPYNYVWGVSSANNGSHTWTAKAYDAAGNVVTSSPASRTVDTDDLPSGFVAVYGFEEDEGTAVMDASGNGNDGGISGAIRTASGRFGDALSFDGADDRIDLSALDVDGGEGLTVSLWMKADDFGTYDARLVSKATGVSENDHYWMLSTFSNNSVRFRLKAGGSTKTLISKSGVIGAGQWHHVTATYDGQRMRIYVDGVEVSSIAKTGVVDTNSGVPAAIGDQPQGGRPFDGLIDEVRLYSRALTGEQIQADMSTPVSTMFVSSDITPPTVSIGTSPVGSSYTSEQTVIVSATATDDRGVARVEFYDGAALKGTDTTSPYRYAWEITDADNGSHTWTAKAFDKAGNLASRQLTRSVSIISLPISDSDGDGVSDAMDQCPSTTADATVNGSGCAASQLDSDGDGVSDAMDQCPGTGAGGNVNGSGCAAIQLDVDSDGVNDAVDQCPSTPVGTPIDGVGCPFVSPLDLVAGHGFEEAEGMISMDASGNGNDGVISGAVRTTAGRFGDALSFDGVDDWIDLSVLDVDGGDGLTVSLWMKADDFGTYDARLVSKATGVSENDHYWMLSTFSNNSVRFRLKAGGSTKTLISKSGVIGAGQWHHVTATYDGQRMRIYVDGVEVGSIAKTGVVDTNSGVPAAIGDQPQGGRPFDGLIDEVRLYNRALTVEQIEDDMVAPVGYPVLELVSYPVLEMEMGEVEVDDQWQRVDFEQPFVDAIVVAKALSYNGADPALVRVDGIDADGFWIRVQEWDYDDGTHVPEVVGYVVMERGRHHLVGGSWVEAGRLQTSTTNAFDRTTFDGPFDETPVVLMAVTSDSGDEAVIARVRRVDVNGFEFGLREQEANDQAHVVETVDYIAWEPSSGVIGDLRYEVDRTQDKVTHVPHVVVYKSAFNSPPVFVADMQTTDGGDTASLRWQNKSAGAVDVWVDEEQSRDSEVSHTTEAVGYFLLEFVD